MTQEQRSEMFAKDCLSISDVGQLLDIGYSMAAKVIRDIKRRSDRLHIRGKIHVKDYEEYFSTTATQPPQEDKPIKTEHKPEVKLLRAKDVMPTLAPPSSARAERKRSLRPRAVKGGNRL